MTTTSFALLINGGPSEVFKATRGVRQRDPLSPLLFILVIGALNGMLCRVKDLQLVKGISVGRKNHTVEVSHLFFADDTLVFCQPEERILLNLRCVLLCFQLVSRLKINLDKKKRIMKKEDKCYHFGAQIWHQRIYR